VLRRIFVIGMGIAAVGSTFIATGASAAPRYRNFTMPEQSDLALSADAGAAAEACKIVGSISHRCLNFDSDSILPQGLADYHGSN
jgi:hypothetical protein